MIVGIGELLWDLFPDGRRELGGAVTNLTYHATQLGDHGILASRIGDDQLGADLFKQVDNLGMDCSYIQRDPIYPTGTVEVQLSNGQPNYIIRENVAFDFPVFDSRWKKIAACADAITFGTLAQRTPHAAVVIEEFLASCSTKCLRLLDVNLRKEFWSANLLDQSLRSATAVKLNDEELPIVLKAIGGNGFTSIDSLQYLVRRYNLKIACLTRGARGSIMLAPTPKGYDIVEHPGLQVPVTDTVGAGDAFSAVVLHHLLRRIDLTIASSAANDYAAFVATQKGGTPKVPHHISCRAVRGV